MFALGLGANGAVFSLVNQVLLRPPVGPANPDELRRLYGVLPKSSPERASIVFSGLAHPYFDAIRTELAHVALVAAYDANRFVNLRVGDASVRVRMAQASADFLPMLGIHPARGRFFTADEDRDTAGVLIVSHELW